MVDGRSDDRATISNKLGRNTVQTYSFLSDNNLTELINLSTFCDSRKTKRNSEDPFFGIKGLHLYFIKNTSWTFQYLYQVICNITEKITEIVCYRLFVKTSSTISKVKTYICLLSPGRERHPHVCQTFPHLTTIPHIFFFIFWKYSFVAAFPFCLDFISELPSPSF